MLIFFNDIANWLQAHPLACPVKKYLHIDCPGCGLQRSFVELLKGNIQSSIACHPATVPLMAFLAYSVLHLFFKFRNGHKIIVWAYLFVVAIVLTNYIYKLSTKT